MRIKHLTISGFRGFTSTVELDLDAGVVLLIGKNGCGKTSLLDAILWCLTGKLIRLDKEPEVVVTRYGGGSGEARVAAVLCRADGSTFTVTRRFDGAMHIMIAGDEVAESRGAAAEAELLRALGRDGASDEAPEMLHEVLTRGIYLQQDRLRTFVESDNDQDRFRVVSDILGVGQVAELQRQLESSKMAWSKSTNAMAKEQEPLQQRRAQLASRLERLTDTGNEAGALHQAWMQWREPANAFLAAPLPEAVPGDASNVIDTALKELHAHQLQHERRFAVVQQLLAHLDNEPAPVPPPTDAIAARAELERALTEQRSQLALLQNAAAAERARLVSAREQAEEMRALAQLALRQLNERCPVCDQDYDHEGTKNRLQRLVTTSQDSAPAAQEPLAQLTTAISENERRLNELNAHIHGVERSATARTEWARVVEQMRDQLDLLHAEDLPNVARTLHTSIQGRIADLATLRTTANQLALSAAKAGELARREEIQRALSDTDAKLAETARQIAVRQQTGERAGALIAALRTSAEDLVAKELEQIGPILQRIYATVDPHPSFRAVQFLTTTTNRRGRVWASLQDTVEGVSVDAPSAVLSSSQLNVLAVSVFLALNLSIDNLPLDLIALDDPLQSLDDVNLLGLVDLLRRVRERRQIIVSTHDAKLGRLLEKKLRPVAAEHRTVVVHLESWGRSGPVIHAADIVRDEEPIRLVAG